MVWKSEYRATQLQADKFLNTTTGLPNDNGGRGLPDDIMDNVMGPMLSLPSIPNANDSISTMKEKVRRLCTRSSLSAQTDTLQEVRVLVGVFRYLGRLMLKDYEFPSFFRYQREPDFTWRILWLLRQRPMPSNIRLVVEKLDQTYINPTHWTSRVGPVSTAAPIWSSLARVVFYYGGILPYLRQKHSGQLVTTWSKALRLRVGVHNMDGFLNLYQNAYATTEAEHQLPRSFLRPLHMDGVNYVYPIGLVNDICNLLHWLLNRNDVMINLVTELTPSSHV